jgi:hypothetical protein
MSGKVVLDSNIIMALITGDKELLKVSFPGLHAMPAHPPVPPEQATNDK